MTERQMAATRRIAALLAAAMLLLPAPAVSGTVPEEGDRIPPLVLETPERPEDRAYLGLETEAGETFSLASLEVPVWVIEIYSMY